MFRLEKKYIITGLISTIFTFIMFFVGVKVILGNNINLRNIMAFAGFSVIVGFVTTVLVFFQYEIAVWCFIVGLLLGFFQMYRSFLNKMSGWGDLVGVLFLLTFSIIGLSTGIIAQLGYFYYKRKKK